MTNKTTIRMGGYGPATTCFSRALKQIGDDLQAQFGDELDIKYVWNILDLGYRSEDILWLVEDGLLTLGYQSSSYLTKRVPEIGIADLPFLFRTNQEARAAIDGELGRFMTEAIEKNSRFRILGYFENGFRHISNRLRPVRTPQDLRGMRIRVLPSDIQARTFSLLGASPLQWDLTEAIAAIVAGTIDAQENPLANTVTYGAHAYHRFHTLTGHFYVSRPIFVHRPSFEAWPQRLQSAMEGAVVKAVAAQRIAALEEGRDALAAIEAHGCEVVNLSAAEHQAFVSAVRAMEVDLSRRGKELLARLRRQQSALSQ
jgi:TRAP-type C4-dicarboxylate transport system substrate-binding protein